jgi:hypothetical protein
VSDADAAHNKQQPRHHRTGSGDRMSDFRKVWMDDDDAAHSSVGGMSAEEMEEVVVLQHSKIKALERQVAEQEVAADDEAERAMLLEADIVKMKMQAKLLRDSLQEIAEASDAWKAR